MQIFFKKNITFLLFLFFISCNNSTELKPTTTNKKDTILPPIDRKKPDPSIEVKDDFTQLTKFDEEKEDKTHMDMSYFPSNYALDKAQQKPVQLLIRVIYSRPHKRDRPVIFGDSTAPVPYDRIWRLGANESTEIEFAKPVVINNKKLNAGRYTLFAIPKKDSWKIIVNSNIYTWGDFNYDDKKNLVQADVQVKNTNFNVETFLIYFQKTITGCSMIMTWDDVAVALPIIIQ